MAAQLTPMIPAPPPMVAIMDDLIKRLRAISTPGMEDSDEAAILEAAAALSAANARVAELEEALRDAVDLIDNGWGTEQVSREEVAHWDDMMPRLRATLAARKEG
jgi:MoxR-like ATPase